MKQVLKNFDDSKMNLKMQMSFKSDEIENIKIILAEFLKKVRLGFSKSRLGKFVFQKILAQEMKFCGIDNN